jgi:malonyl-CoA O-methyltransferase
LEIGCGTGFLAEQINGRLIDADWLMTDLSSTMIERARRRFAGVRGFRFGFVNGDSPELPGEVGFDLVCSSLAAQWFEDLPCAIARQFKLLRKNGRLMMTTLALGTLKDWRDAHEAEGCKPGSPDYPSLAALQSMKPDGARCTIQIRSFTEAHRSAAEFMRSLRKIGANTPRSAHTPLSPATLRAVSRRFEAAGATARYEVALLNFTRLAGAG